MGALPTLTWMPHKPHKSTSLAPVQGLYTKGDTVKHMSHSYSSVCEIVELTYWVLHPGCQHWIAAFDSTPKFTTIPHKHPLRSPIWWGALLCLLRPDVSTSSSLSGPPCWILQQVVNWWGVHGDLDHLVGSCYFIFRSVQTLEFNTNEDSHCHFPHVLWCSKSVHYWQLLPSCQHPWTLVTRLCTSHRPDVELIILTPNLVISEILQYFAHILPIFRCLVIIWLSTVSPDIKFCLKLRGSIFFSWQEGWTN